MKLPGLTAICALICAASWHDKDTHASRLREEVGIVKRYCVRGLSAQVRRAGKHCMTKSKFYAVKKGLRPGIYHTWAECQEQTHGVSGAAFKSFSTQQAADQYLEAGTVPLEKKRTHSQSRGLCSAQRAASTEEAVCTTSDSADLLKQAGAAAQRATDAAVPAWVEPDRLYRLVLF